MKHATEQRPSKQPASSLPIDATQSINDTVLAYPFTLPVFAEYDLDTCCRGALSIQDAANQAGIDVSELLEKLDHVVSARGE